MWKFIWTCTLWCLGCVFAVGQLDITAGMYLCVCNRSECDESMMVRIRLCIYVSEEAERIPVLMNADKRSQILFRMFGGQEHLPRHKRDVFLSSGVRLCYQETVQQAITNHLKYYQLRGERLLQYYYY